MAKKAAAGKGKKGAASTVKSVESELNIIQGLVMDAIDEGTKFDNKERGWSPAGGRIRKSLQLITVSCKELRKYISEVKNAEK